jgi:ketosteroid isomerase-like protein
LFSFLGSGNEGAMPSFPMTRQLIMALIVVFVSVMGAQAESGDVAKVLMVLENSWVNALVNADTAKLDAILVDTYADTEDGHQSDKQGTLTVLKSGDLKFKSIKLSNMKVYAYGNAAVVTGMAAQDGTFKGQPMAPKLVFTDTFVLQDGTWKAAASHRTTAPK